MPELQAEPGSEYLRQSRTLARHWGAAGVAARCHEVPGANHFTVIAGLANPDDPLVDMLVELAGVA